MSIVVKPGGAGAVDELVGKGGECFDLLLPLGLERGGGDDEDAPRFAKVAEQGAGGDGLNGFAQPHFVGEQDAFAEGEVKHPLALVGVKRVEGDVLGVAAADDAGSVVAAEGTPFGGADPTSLQVPAGDSPAGCPGPCRTDGGGGSLTAPAAPSPPTRNVPRGRPRWGNGLAPLPRNWHGCPPPVKKLLPYYRHLFAVKWHFAAGVLAGMVFAVSSGAGLPAIIDVVFPVLFDERRATEGSRAEVVEWIQNHLGGHTRDRLLLIVCLGIPLVFAIRALSGYLNAYLIHYSGLRVVESIRDEMFVKLQSLPLSYYRKNKAGDLLARLMADTEVLRQAIAQSSSDLIKQPLTLIAALSFLAVKAVNDRSFFIAIIAILSVPLCVLIIRTAGNKLAKRARALQECGGDLTAALAESLQSPLEIRAYNLQERQISMFRTRIRHILKLTMKVVKYRQAISPSIDVVAALGFAMALFFGVRAGLEMSGFITLGAALYMAYDPVKKLGNIHSVFRQAAVSVDRVEYILNERDTLADPPQPRPCPVPQRSIRFENVTFAYGDEPVLHALELEIPVGQVVALVGPSGAGKSTFAGLIPRFYDPQEGRLTIDGIDVREFNKKDLRSRIAIVPQMPALFLGSFADNIRVGRLDASDAEVREAARRAHADEFILEYPDGFDTSVGERGDLLSGGQRQRIAIARAFLRDAPILILDEATSALDSDSEAAVQAALAELVKGRTTFIIAHRFSTITIADRILAFQRGRVVADGTHESLRDVDPIYRAMVGSELVAAERWPDAAGA